MLADCGQADRLKRDRPCLWRAGGNLQEQLLTQRLLVHVHVHVRLAALVAESRARAGDRVPCTGGLADADDGPRTSRPRRSLSVTSTRNCFVLLTPLVVGRTPAIFRPTALAAATDAPEAAPDLVAPDVTRVEVGCFESLPVLDWLAAGVPVPADPLPAWQLS